MVESGLPGFVVTPWWGIVLSILIMLETCKLKETEA
jgi:hypothetical protein